MSKSDRFSGSGIPKKNALAVAIGVALTGQNSADAQQAEETHTVGEIIVTAQKRAENLQDVSFSIQALSEEDFVRQGLFKFEDYVRFLPSVTFVSTTPGATNIVFRGVAADAGGSISDSSSAIYLDEQPLTQFNIQVDPRLVDIERVEALAGPQGTLYGDSSQSGTIRIITNKPDASKFAAFTDVTVRDGHNSAGSYDVSGMLNIPLVEDKLALRLVGFSVTEGGFIDHVAGTSPTLGASTPERGLKTTNLIEDHINDVNINGGRASIRWTPDASWSVTGAFVIQNTEADGLNDYDKCFDPANCTRILGDLETVKFFEEPRDDKWWQTALTIEKSFGNNLKFLSATSYFDRKIKYTIDRTEYAGYFNYQLCPSYATYCFSGTTVDNQDTTAFNDYSQENHRFTQEFRLSGEESRYRWVAGLFWEHKTQEWFYRAYTPEFLSTLAYDTWTSTYTANPAGEPAWWFSHDDVDWNQWAVFGDFTFDITDQWIVSVGARYFDQESERVYEVDKRFITAPGVWPDFAPDTGKRKSDDSDWVPKVSLTYKFNSDNLVYGLFSEGFRAGGVNRNRRPSNFEQYDPDKLTNYELGAKTRWLDGRLQVNATLFYMKWKDFQTELIDPAFGTTTCDIDGDGTFDELCPFQVLVVNAGDAEQKGAEISVRAAVGEGWDLGLDATWLNAELSDDLIIDPDPDAERPSVPSGSSLPMVPDLKGSVYVQYNWPVNFVPGGSMSARLQYSYVDDMLNRIEPFPEAAPGDSPNTPQRKMDAYGIADFIVSLSTDKWELQGFVNNFTDERAELFWNTDDHQTFWGHNNLVTNRPSEYGIRYLYKWGGK